MARNMADLVAAMMGTRGGRALPRRGDPYEGLVDETGNPVNEAAADIMEEIGAPSPMMQRGMVPGRGGPMDVYQGGTVPDEEMQEGETGPDTTDEEMLENVSRGMGGPPEGSGMKWQDVDEDRTALEANPSTENIEAFTSYWGEEALPESLRSSSDEGE